MLGREIPSARPAETDANLAPFDLGGIRLEINAHRSSLGLSRGNVKPPLMPGTLDDFPKNKSVRQYFFFVRAQPVGCIKPSGRVVHGIWLALVFKWRNIFFVDVVHSANRNPGKNLLRHNPHPGG